MSVDDLAVDDDAASYTCPEGYHYEVLHTPGCAVSHFPHCRSIGIIGQGDFQPACLPGEEFGKRDRLGSAPDEVHRILDGPGVVVPVRRTDSDSAYLSCRADKDAG